MQDEPTKQSGRTVQRVIALQLLGRPRWSCAGLKVELHDIDPQTIDGELTVLVTKGVAVYDGAQVQASCCARHMDALGLVGV